MAHKNPVTIDPLARPTVPAGKDHYFRICFRPFVPTFQNIAIQNKRQVKIMIYTMGLAEAIIDDTCPLTCNLSSTARLWNPLSLSISESGFHSLVTSSNSTGIQSGGAFASSSGDDG